MCEAQNKQSTFYYWNSYGDALMKQKDSQFLNDVSREVITLNTLFNELDMKSYNINAFVVPTSLHSVTSYILKWNDCLWTGAIYKMIWIQKEQNTAMAQFKLWCTCKLSNQTYIFLTRIARSVAKAFQVDVHF